MTSAGAAAALAVEALVVGGISAAKPVATSRWAAVATEICPVAIDWLEVSGILAATTLLVFPSFDSS